MKDYKKAFIDLGTNTFHCKILEFQRSEFKEVFYEKTFVQLGEGGFKNNQISENALSRAIHAIDKFQSIIASHKVNDVHALGTSALRSLKGIESFRDKMNAFNWHLEIIEGKREAELIFKGVGLDKDISIDGNTLVMDIGGGSVEFIYAEKGKIEYVRSFEIGAQRLKDKFHRSEPISEAELLELSDYISSNLKELDEVLMDKSFFLVGSAGTFETLNLIAQNSEKFMSKDSFHNIHEKLCKSNLEERKQIPKLHPGRAEMIVVASSLVNYILDTFNLKGFYISDYSLKEGLIKEELEKRKAKIG